MYQLDMTKQIYRTDPWKKPYDDRIESLKAEKKQGRNIIAFLYPVFDASTFRYRGYNVAETLEYSFRWYGSYFEVSEMDRLQQQLEYIDIVVIIRCAWNPELEKFIEIVKNRGIKLCYDVDDLIYSAKYMPSLMEALGFEHESEWNFWFGLMGRNYAVAERCDAFITTNGYLSEHLQKDFKRNCYIVKNYLNWLQEDVSSEYFAIKQRLDAEKPFEIGYFSGSPTHLRDLLVIMPELEQFLEKHENAIFRIVGYMDLPKEYGHLVEKKKIQFVPFQTFIGLQYQQARVDVNVVPLVNNEFSNCKSELKYFESAIVGTLTCATPSYTYSGAISNGENGYLCEKGEWLPVFEKLYEQGVHKEQQAYIRQRALEEYSGKNQIKSVEDVFESILQA